MRKGTIAISRPNGTLQTSHTELSRILSAPIQITPTGLTLPEDLTQNQWQLLVPWFRAARLANETQTWALVDWLAFGGRKFCERDDITGRFKLTASFSRYRAAAELTGYDEGTLQNLATLGRRVPQAIRIPPDKLSVTHHVCICAVADEGDQRKLLEQAVEHGWSCSELREAVRSLFATAPGQAGSAISSGQNLLGVRVEIQRIFSALESKRPLAEWPPAQREAIRHDLTELQKLLAQLLERLAE